MQVGARAWIQRRVLTSACNDVGRWALTSEAQARLYLVENCNYRRRCHDWRDAEFENEGSGFEGPGR